MAFADAFDSFVTDFLRDQVAPNALPNDLPVVGDALDSIANDFSFPALRNAIAQALNGVANNPSAIKSALDALSAATPGITLTTTVVGDNVEVRVQTTQAETVNLAGRALDVGGSAIGLDATANFSGGLSAALDITLTYDTLSDQIDVVAVSGDELVFTAGVGADIAGTGNLGPLAVSLQDQTQGQELNLALGVDIGPGQSYTVGTPAPLTPPELRFRLETALAGGILPSVFADVTATWGSTLSAAPTVEFGNVGIDLEDLAAVIDQTIGELTDVLFTGPVGSLINGLIDPIPVIDPGLRAIGLLGLFDRIPTGGGDGTLNFLDIAGGYLESQGETQLLQTLSVAAEALGVLKAIDTIAATGEVILGDFSVNPNGTLDPFQVDPNDPLNQLSSLLGGVFTQAIDAVEGLVEGGNKSLSDADLDDEEGFRFPLFEQPAQIVNLLLPGLTGNLSAAPTIVEYDIPALTGEINLGPYFFSIFGPIGVTLSGGLGFNLDFRIGYDLEPVRNLLFPDQYTGGTNLLDGLFIGVDALEENERLPGQSLNRIYEHRPLAFTTSEVFAGVGVNAVVVEVAVEGGVTGFSGSFIGGTIDTPVSNDTYNPAATTDRARLSDFGSSCFFDPIVGTVNAVIRARFTINFFFFSFSWEATFAQATIVDLEFGCDPEPDPVRGIASASPNGNILELHAGLQADAGNRVVNGTLVTDAADHYRVGNARDAETGALIPGQLTVSWRGLSTDFAVNADGVILAVMDNLVGSQFADSLVLDEDVTQALSVFAGGDNDVIIGALGDDTINGGAGDDRLFGNEGDDRLIGEGGNDLLVGGPGSDFKDGGLGTDKVDYSENTTAVIMTLAGLNTYTVSGGDADGDVLVSIEEIIGSAFDDVLYTPLITFNGQGDVQGNALEGREGNDALIGLVGNDLLIGGPGADAIFGGSGQNATSYVTSWGGVEVDLATGRGRRADAEGDRLENIGWLQGSPWSDVLLGSAGPNNIEAFDGDDLVKSQGGADTIHGGDGDDTVVGALSGALLNGDAEYKQQADVTSNRGGRDLLSYEDVTGSGVTVDLFLNSGSLFGLAFKNTDPSESDTIQRLPALMLAEQVVGVFAFSTFEDLRGSRFSDTLRTDDAPNRVEGLEGNDVIATRGGDDTIIGDDGADNVNGGDGRDLIDYSAGFGVSVNLDTGAGLGDIAQGDVLTNLEDVIGTVGADGIIGNASGNRVDPGLSRDDANQLSPGGNIASAGDSVNLLGGPDVIDTLVIDWSRRDTGTGLRGGFTSPTPGSGSLRRDVTPGGALLDGVSFANVERLEITGTIGDDNVEASEADDILLLGGGNDIADPGSGVDIVILGEGEDEATYRGPASAITGGVAEDAHPFLLDGGRGIDGISLDFSDSGQDLTIIGAPGLAEFEGVNLVTQDGGVVQNFERLADVTTGAGDDTVEQRGLFDNAFATGDGPDVLRPGLGTDTADGGRDFSEGDEIVTYVTVPGITALFDIETEDIDVVLQNGGDLLDLDFSAATAGVTGSTQRAFSGVFVLGYELFTNVGSYLGGNGDVDLNFEQIERMSVVGTGFADVLTGSHDSYLEAPWVFATAANFSRGDDLLVGGEGTDTLVGYSGDDVLEGGPGDDVLIGGDPSADGVAEQTGPGFLVDPDELDLLTGGPGADTFVLGITYVVNPLDPVTAGSLYVGTNSRNAATITDFDPVEGDVLQLAGAASDYVTDSDGTNLFLYRDLGGGALDLIATLEGVETLDLSGAAVDYVGPGNLGEGSTLAPLAAINPAPTSAPPSSPAPQLSASGWVTQENDPDDLLTALFAGGGAGVDRSNERLELVGDGRAFGVFNGDPFGLGSGILLSTGVAEDLAGPNREDGGLGGPVSKSLKFEDIGSLAGDANTVYRAQLTNIGTDIASLIFTDDGDFAGGSGGIFSGTDIDAIVLSEERLDSIDASVDFNDPALLPRLDVFDFSAASARFFPGEQRSVPASSAAFGDDFAGSVNGLVHASLARLDRRDAQNTAGTGYLTLGEGGTLALDLTETVDTNRELYLYLVEAGSKENLEGAIRVSSDRLEPEGDLSTDFGAPGPAGDTVSMTYTFEAAEDIGGLGVVAFDFVFFSEEFIEFAGAEDNDAISITLNGVELAALSDDAALAINTLRPAPLAASHPDFIWTPAETGRFAGETRADGVTQEITFAGVLQSGQNELKIELREQRDGWLDSGVLIEGGSFNINSRGSDIERPDLLMNGTTLVEGAAPTPVLVTLPAPITGSVRIEFRPTVDIDLGAGPGVSVQRRLEPGDPLSFALDVRAVDEGALEGPEFTPISISVISDDPGYDGLPVAPVIFEIQDAGGPPPAPPSGPIGEVGSVTITQTTPDQWHSVSFAQPLDDPSVVMGPLSTNDPEPATVRVRNVTSLGFEFQVQEWDYLDGIHGTETLDWIAVEPGVHLLDNGLRLEAGTTAGTPFDRNVTLTPGFSGGQVVLAQVASDNGEDALIPRISNVTANTFDVRLHEQEDVDGLNVPVGPPGGVFPLQDVDWIAVEGGAAPEFFLGQTLVDETPSQVSYGGGFSETPALFAAMQSLNGADPATVRASSRTASGTTLFLEEEQSADSEIGHINETVGIFALKKGILAIEGVLPPPPPSGTIGEVGTVTVTQNDANQWHAVSFSETLSDAVVVMGPLSFNGGEPATVRLRNRTDTGFEFQIDEWDYLDGGHTAETLSWVAVEAGAHVLPNGVTIEAGTTTGDATPSTVGFNASFPGAPVVFGQAASANGTEAVASRLFNITAQDFEFRLQEQESGDGVVAADSFDWLAVEAGQSPGFFADVTGETVTHQPSAVSFGGAFSGAVGAPALFAAMQTFNGPDPSTVRAISRAAGGTTLFVEEEQSADAETRHNLAESVGVFALDEGLLTIGTPPPPPPPSGTIGEVGTVTITQDSASQWHAVSFAETLTDAAVVMGPLSFNGGEPATVRVRNRTDTGFEFQLDEWDYLDGAHIAETVSWMAVEAGTHVLSNGVTIEAGFTSGNATPSTVGFSTAFAAAPVVLGQVTSANGAEAVATRFSDITAQDFAFRLQEQESGDGVVATDSFDWIALDTGQSAGFFADVTGETVTHQSSAVSFAGAFAGTPALFAAMQTFNGPDPATVRAESRSSSGADLFIEEEKSADAETRHNLAESVGVVAIDEGLLTVGAPPPPPPPSGPIGEVGTVTITQDNASQWHAVSFSETLTDAVVVMGPLSFNGAQPATVRVRDRTDTGFEFQIDEWDYLDGAHIAETVSWMAMETGTHVLSNGVTIEAGTTTGDATPSTVGFAASFAAAPLVLGQVTSADGAEAVATRVSDVTVQDFAFRFQEQESGDGIVAADSFDWIALDTGQSAGFFADVTAETVTHKPSAISFADAFAGPPALFAGMQTFNGPDPSTVRALSRTASGAEFFIEEEESADAETRHNLEESVGILALDAGLIFG